MHHRSAELGSKPTRPSSATDAAAFGPVCLLVTLYVMTLVVCIPTDQTPSAARCRRTPPRPAGRSRANRTTWRARGATRFRPWEAKTAPRRASSGTRGLFKRVFGSKRRRPKCPASAIPCAHIVLGPCGTKRNEAKRVGPQSWRICLSDQSHAGQGPSVVGLFRVTAGVHGPWRRPQARPRCGPMLRPERPLRGLRGSPSGPESGQRRGFHHALTLPRMQRRADARLHTRPLPP